MKDVAEVAVFGLLGLLLLFGVVASCADQVDCWSRGGTVVKSYSLKGYSCIPAVKP